MSQHSADNQGRDNDNDIDIEEFRKSNQIRWEYKTIYIRQEFVYGPNNINPVFSYFKFREIKDINKKEIDQKGYHLSTVKNGKGIIISLSIKGIRKRN